MCTVDVYVCTTVVMCVQPGNRNKNIVSCEHTPYLVYNPVTATKVNHMRAAHNKIIVLVLLGVGQGLAG